MPGEDSTRGEPRQTRRILFGGLLILGLFAGALLIFFLDDLLGAFDREYEIHVVLPGATGITPDSPVWVSGREIGLVNSVGFLPAGGDSLARVVVGVRLPISVQPHVRADSEVRLTSVSVISARVIDIMPGTASGRILGPGDTLRQGPLLTPAQLTARAAIVQSDMRAALGELQELTPAVRARLLQTERSFAGLDAVMGEVQRLQSDLDANPGLAVLQSPEFALALERTRSHAAELPDLFGRLRDSSGPAAEVRTALARLQARADSLGARLTAASAALENPNSTLARMQQDTAITRAINAARMDLDSLIADMRRNPLRYVY